MEILQGQRLEERQTREGRGRWQAWLVLQEPALLTTPSTAYDSGISSWRGGEGSTTPWAALEMASDVWEHFACRATLMLSL